jgi:hypothetical protein
MRRTKEGRRRTAIFPTVTQESHCASGLIGQNAGFVPPMSEPKGGASCDARPRYILRAHFAACAPAGGKVPRGEDGRAGRRCEV